MPRLSNEAFYRSLSARERALFDVITVIADTLFKDTERFSSILNMARQSVEAADIVEAFDTADVTKH